MTGLLKVRDLRTSFFTGRGVVKAVDGVSFEIGAGETLGLVGESGCGKSMTALSIMRLVPRPQGRIVGGEVIFEGRNLCELSEKELCRIRGAKIGMVFQEPMSLLNPLYTVGEQIAEVLQLHLKLQRKAAWERAARMLEQVGIPAADQRLRDYPHQLSGGMRQRVMIAMALACRPRLLIADEPTTALDVTIQAQILELLKRLKREMEMAVLLITHDLGIVADVAQRAAVMYAGRIVELADTAEIFQSPGHPYTEGLLRCIPGLDEDGGGKKRLAAIPGSVPDLAHLPVGCSFQDRCPHRMPICLRQAPCLRLVGDGHWVSCWRVRESA